MKSFTHALTRRQLLLDGGKLAVSTGLLGSFLAACGGASPSSNAATNALAYWALNYEPKGANQTGKLTDAAINGFMKAHTGIKVNVTGYTGDQAGFTKLTQAIQASGTVDVFRLSADELPVLIKQKLVSPIDDFLGASDKSGIYPNLLSAVQTQGKHYAWPLWVPPIGMYINLDIFKERNVDPPSDDWTYEQFVDTAKRLTFTRSNGQKVYGYTGIIDPAAINTWPIILSDGALPFNQDNTKYTFNSPEGISGLQKLADLALKHKVTPPDFGTQASSDIVTGFSQTKTYAMYSAPSGDAATYKAAGLNFDVKAMPIGGLGKHVTAGGIGLIAVATIQDQERLKQAMQLADYLTSAQVGKDVSGYYLAPGARQSITVDDPISKFTPFVAYCYIPPLISQWTQIRTILHPQIQQAVLGKISPAQALNGPASEINSLLAGS
ncbi:sugar ABC transporter substrate-binding protein [Ktedonosporobacter rubrisoli]|uniref:Sugar ABC transporter substrate-binding protein n=1 Tax=Ktedonosporobacter rubrisoli TaxID=2509675 RepID=A0A4P6K597_KTERU|nr:sugar ABC transporter substrate-binding protein [Ktedonosporobacter rubrisoli]QBD83030.1 sugar ABC transporter substrate-binding protein [Ktedonosporobacter rubrisoli]